MATVRTLQDNTASIVVGVGMGAKNVLEQVKTYAENLGAELASSRLLVDHDYMPYEKQVGLTGKSINPDVYLALGISGAVHHIAGIRQSQTIIAVNHDKNAPIFQYADYGIICEVEEIL
jgi:electron transfer flavoprotein alpha subunit